jgi:hypothetical protein
VLELRADDGTRFGPALEALAGGVRTGSEKPESPPMILERIA